MFLREAERQRLQALLHSEVLRCIIMLQRRFRALLERQHFVRMREAAICIQVQCRDLFWRMLLRVVYRAELLRTQWDFERVNMIISHSDNVNILRSKVPLAEYKQINYSFFIWGGFPQFKFGSFGSDQVKNALM